MTLTVDLTNLIVLQMSAVLAMLTIVDSKGPICGDVVGPLIDHVRSASETTAILIYLGLVQSISSGAASPLGSAPG